MANGPQPGLCDRPSPCSCILRQIDCTWHIIGSSLYVCICVYICVYIHVCTCYVISCYILSNCLRQTRHRALPRVCVFSRARCVCVCVCLCVLMCWVDATMHRFIDAFVDSPIRPMPRFILRFINVSNASDVVVSLSSSGTFQFVVQLLC